MYTRLNKQNCHGCKMHVWHWLMEEFLAGHFTAGDDTFRLNPNELFNWDEPILLMAGFVST